MAANPFATIRLGVFGILLLFSLIVLGLSANLTSKTIGFSFPGFSVAVAILTMVITIPMIVIDMQRKGSFVSWVATELAWNGLLWILWLSAAAVSTSTVFFTGDCSFWGPDLESLCRQYSALQAFSWLNWLLLTVYIISLIVLSVLATVKGNSRVWLSPASDLSFSPTHTHSGEPKIPPPANYNSPNYTGTPGAYPPGQQQPVGYNAGSNYAASPVMAGAQYNQFAPPTQNSYAPPVSQV